MSPPPSLFEAGGQCASALPPGRLDPPRNGARGRGPRPSGPVEGVNGVGGRPGGIGTMSRSHHRAAALDAYLEGRCLTGPGCSSGWVVLAMVKRRAEAAGSPSSRIAAPSSDEDHVQSSEEGTHAFANIPMDVCIGTSPTNRRAVIAIALWFCGFRKPFHVAVIHEHSGWGPDAGNGHHELGDSHGRNDAVDRYNRWSRTSQDAALHAVHCVTILPRLRTREICLSFSHVQEVVAD